MKQMFSSWPSSPSPSAPCASRVAFADAAAASAERFAAAKWPDNGMGSFWEEEGFERCGGRCLPLPLLALVVVGLLLLLLLRGWRGVGCELEEVDEEGGGAVDPFDGGVALSPVSCPEKAALRDIAKSVVGRWSGGEGTVFCHWNLLKSRLDRRGQVFRLTRLRTPQRRLVAEGGKGDPIGDHLRLLSSASHQVVAETSYSFGLCTTASLPWPSNDLYPRHPSSSSFPLPDPSLPWNNP